MCAYHTRGYRVLFFFFKSMFVEKQDPFKEKSTHCAKQNDRKRVSTTELRHQFHIANGMFW